MEIILVLLLENATKHFQILGIAVLKTFKERLKK